MFPDPVKMVPQPISWEPLVKNITASLSSWDIYFLCRSCRYCIIKTTSLKAHLKSCRCKIRQRTQHVFCWFKKPPCTSDSDSSHTQNEQHWKKNTVRFSGVEKRPSSADLATLTYANSIIASFLPIHSPSLNCFNNPPTRAAWYDRKVFNLMTAIVI